MQVSFRPSLTGGFVLNRWPFDVEKMMTNYDKLLELRGNRFWTCWIIPVGFGKLAKGPAIQRAGSEFYAQSLAKT